MSEELEAGEKEDRDPVLNLTSRQADAGIDVGAKLEEVALQHKIPLAQDTALTASLATVSQGNEMPPQLFAAIAAVLSFFNSVERSRSD